ncbi:MAG TPA: DUF4908 domain-containing protein [Caulobacteraceae bacterium]|jgi:hypothetical protein
MAPTPRALIGWKAPAAVLAAVASMGMAGAPAWVQNALSLGRADQLHAVPTVARFRLDEGGDFVLDRSSHSALLRFENGPDATGEIWVVAPSRGPRGDIMFKDDVGDILLRVTKLGGVTAFTTHWPSGAAASLDGKTAPLRLAAMGPTQLYQRLVYASTRSSRAARHLVAFEAPDSDARSAPLLGETAWVAMQAFVSLSAEPRGLAAAAKIRKVVLLHGSKPGVKAQRGAVTVIVDPGDGLVGHPSSARIAQAIERQ